MNKVKQLRMQRKWTQKDLADEIRAYGYEGGIAIPDISAMERGKLPIGPVRAYKLAAAFGIEPSELWPVQRERRTPRPKLILE